MHKTLEKQLRAQFYRGNRGVFALAVFAALAGGTLNLIVTWLMQQLIDAASGAPGALPLAALAEITGGFVVLCAVLFLLKYASEPRFIARAMRQYKELAFQKLTEKSIASFRDESTAAYLSALTNDAASVEADYLAQQLAVITKTVTFFGALFMMLWYSPLLTAIAVGVTALPLAASLLTGGRLQAAEKKVSERNRDFTAALSDCLSGFAVVKTFKAEREIFQLFAESNRALEQEKFSRRRLKVLIGMIGAVTGLVAQLGVFLAGAWLALSGSGLTAGTVILFVNLMNFMIGPVSELPALLAGRRAALGLIGKLADALEKDGSAGGSRTLSRLEHGIELRDVSFGYEEGKDVLRHVSAHFEAGRAYAIVGGSGSGKSTLLNLLLTENTGYRGSVLLDGTELRELSPEALYGLMSVIQQNVFVFNASIRDNVSMFREFPQEALDEAIRRAHLRELLDARGADYLCGENGKGLSGGEKQRVSIARSLLKKSSVLLVDEATAALDMQTAHQVSSDILDLTGMTRIVVTHSLEEALLRRYDGIFVLKNGTLAESGSFDELMQRKGYFYALFTVAQ
ncbi:MAG: ABC transporter ATP-binding protein [Oscillospiraceae bacterium]|nr:ABC transporter ATP-binding protein [Oscillospiraceae bacterium]